MSIVSIRSGPRRWLAALEVGDQLPQALQPTISEGHRLARAFDAMSASSNSLRLACAQHGASVIGPGARSAL
jgi:hypothetical protein